LPCQPLEDLGQELGRDAELVGDPLCAYRAALLMDGDVVDGHQSVVGSFRETQHTVLPVKGDYLSRRPFQSEFTPRPGDVKENPAGTGESLACLPGRPEVVRRRLWRLLVHEDPPDAVDPFGLRKDLDV